MLQAQARQAVTVPPSACSRLLSRRPFLGASLTAFCGPNNSGSAGAQPTRSRGQRLAPQAIAEPPVQAPPAAAEQEAPAPVAPFDWASHWYPIAYVHDVPEKEPYAFTLLNEPIVIWKDGSGSYRCLRDACPHRLVPLSDGRVAPNGELQCPYHGWQFKGCGTCTLMPQGGNPSDPRAAATAYQCAEKQGLVWVKLKPVPNDGTEPDTSDIVTLPELDDPDWFGFGDMFRDIPYDVATLYENVIDAGHVPFTHHGSVSKRQSSGDFSDMRVTERGQYGFKGVWPTGPRKGGLGAQHTLFQGPVLMRHTIDAYDTRGFANITAVYGVPTTPGRCRAIVRQPFRFKNKLVPKLFKIMPAFRGHLGNNSVLDEDNRFLHLQEQEAVRRGMGVKPIGQVYYMPAASDAYVSAFRNWLASVAGGGPWGPMNGQYLEKAGPRLSDDELLEHYHSHTENCSICMSALRNIRLARAAAALVGAAGAMVATAALMIRYAAAAAQPDALIAAAGQAAGLTRLAVVGAAVAAAALLVWNWCERTIPRFYMGQRPHARNRVPGEWSP